MLAAPAAVDGSTAEKTLTPDATYAVQVLSVVDT
jgi:hypothetical protein